MTFFVPLVVTILITISSVAIVWGIYYLVQFGTFDYVYRSSSNDWETFQLLFSIQVYLFFVFFLSFGYSYDFKVAPLGMWVEHMPWMEPLWVLSTASLLYPKPSRGNTWAQTRSNLWALGYGPTVKEKKWLFLLMLSTFFSLFSTSIFQLLYVF